MSPVILPALLAVVLQSASSTPERVLPNDNRLPAGRIERDIRVLRLETRLAMWYPHAGDGPGALVPAFAEVGQPARIPGPLLRVRAGSTVEVHLHNTLPRDTVVVTGLHDWRTVAATSVAPITLAPGARATARFTLSRPGTFAYWATTMRRPLSFRTREDAMLTGAIVVDDSSGRIHPDRVIVLSMWSDTVHRARTHRRRVLGVMNGLSWPHSERLRHTVGDTIRWRVINATADGHPMHLHGFYFRVDDRFDLLRDSSSASRRGALTVTETMFPAQVATLTWIPERAGNWLFHCHVPEHFGPRGPLGVEPGVAGPTLAGGPTAGHDAHANHAASGMNGLVMGIEVGARTGTSAPSRTVGVERSLRLLVRPQLGSTKSTPIYGYAVHERGTEPPPDSGLRAAPTLALTRGQRVRITIVNRLDEPTAVHWHGIELESYFDGVPGFSGKGGRVTPMIAPGDSFEVRFTPPRAGTFIYHTHADEYRQQLAGLVGALIVLEPGQRLDPARDFVFLISEQADPAAQGRAVLVNARTRPAPLQLEVGTTYRLRFIQMTTSLSIVRAELLRDSTHLQWHLLAKDGATLPPHARVLQPARPGLGIGETFDVSFTPDRPGQLRLDIRGGERWPARTPLLGSVPINVIAKPD